jgi:hypothetical protein
MFEDEYFYFGILRGSGDMMKRSIAKWTGTIIFVIMHILMQDMMVHNPWYRITKNSTHQFLLRKSLVIDMNSILNKICYHGAQMVINILVCPPTGAIEWFFDAQEWLNTTIKTLNQYTNREIIVRDKPMDPQVATQAGITQLVGFNKKTIDKPLDMRIWQMLTQW